MTRISQCPAEIAHIWVKITESFIKKETYRYIFEYPLNITPYWTCNNFKRNSELRNAGSRQVQYDDYCSKFKDWSWGVTEDWCTITSLKHPWSRVFFCGDLHFSRGSGSSHDGGLHEVGPCSCFFVVRDVFSDQRDRWQLNPNLRWATGLNAWICLGQLMSVGSKETRICGNGRNLEPRPKPMGYFEGRAFRSRFELKSIIFFAPFVVSWRN